MGVILKMAEDEVAAVAVETVLPASVALATQEHALEMAEASGQARRTQRGTSTALAS